MHTPIAGGHPGRYLSRYVPLAKLEATGFARGDKQR